MNFSSKPEDQEIVRLTIDQTIKIEPKLKMAQDYVKSVDVTAKKRTIMWFSVWRECKKILWPLVGFAAMNPKLQDSYYWDLWHSHLSKLSKYTK
jgi:hypothetical protein